jgi:hypothetical protein
MMSNPICHPLKVNLRAGQVTRLRRDAHQRAPDAWQRSGLDSGALNHPAIVIDTLRADHEYVWVCMVRANIGEGSCFSLYCR